MLGVAAMARIGPVFSAAEQGRARAAAGRDPRLRISLEAAGYGLTQTLVAASQLVARWTTLDRPHRGDSGAWSASPLPRLTNGHGESSRMCSTRWSNPVAWP